MHHPHFYIDIPTLLKLERIRPPPSFSLQQYRGSNATYGKLLHFQYVGNVPQTPRATAGRRDHRGQRLRRV